MEPPAQRRWPAGTAVLALALWTAAAAWPGIGGDFRYTRLATEVSFWGREDYFPVREQRRDTAAAARALLQTAPANPDYLVLSATISGWLAHYSLREDNASRHYRDAIALQRRALVVRPANLADWRDMARLAAAAEDTATRDLARSRALQLRGERN